MDQFIQYTPTEVVFGKETENQAGAEVKNGAAQRCSSFTEAEVRNGAVF